MTVLYIFFWIYFHPILASDLNNTMPYFNPFKQDSIPECPPGYTQCLSLDDLVHKATNLAFDQQIKFEQVVQMHQNVQVMVGRLLPSLNFGIIKSIASLDPTVVTSVVGFIFPSNWYRWKESKKLLVAQQWSFYTFLSAQVRMAEVLYYSIHLLHTYRYIYSHYLNYIDAAVNYFQENENPSVHSAEIHLMKVFRSEIAQKEFETQKDLEYHIPQLLTILGYTKEDNWEGIFIKKNSFPQNPNYTKLILKDYIEKANNRSPILKTNKELYKAAHFNKKTLYFDWVDPNGQKDNGLGYGLYNKIKIIQSQQKQILIQEKKIYSTIQSQLKSIIGPYNIYTDYYAENLKGIREASILIEIIRGKILKELPFSVQQLFLGLGKAMIFDLTKANIQHAMVLNISYLNNVTLEGKYYEDLDILVPYFKVK